MTTPKDQQQLTVEERSFLLPSDNDVALVEDSHEEPAEEPGALLNFVQRCTRCGFPTPLLTKYLRSQEIALTTWAEATQCSKDDLAFAVVAHLSPKAKRKHELIIISRLGEKAAAAWLSRPNVQTLLAEIAAGKQGARRSSDGEDC